MVKKYIPLLIAVVGIGSAFLLVKRVMAPIPEQVPLVLPSSNPFFQAVAASGIVEAVHDNIAIGAPLPGVVEKVFVNVWQTVKAGDPLFRLDTREVQAQLAVERSNLEVAKARMRRIEDQFHRLRAIDDPRAISTDLLRTKENDVIVAEQEVLFAAASVQRQEALLDRLTVRAPSDGVIIQKKVAEGEFLSLTPKEPAVLLGDIRELQIRADIDEQNAAEVCVGACATAYPKNNPQRAIRLQFVRIEPYVIPKKSLTGMSDERVDTRVLQVIYRFEPPKEYTLYVGQQVDLFIDAKNEKSS